MVLAVTLLTLVIFAAYAAAGRLADASAPEMPVPRTAKQIVFYGFRIALILTLVLGGLILLITYVPYAIDAYRLVFVAIAFMLIRWAALAAAGQAGLDRPVFRLGANAVAAALAVGWILVPNWLTRDLCAMCMAVGMLIRYGSIRLRLVVAIFIGVILYDAVAVFGTGSMQGFASKVMEMPVMVTIPSGFSLDAPRLFGLGLGDIVLPGLMMMVAMREARKRATRSLALGAFAGYGLGLVAALVMVIVSRHPQPATIYLMPAVAAGFLLPAARRGIVRELWQNA